jgi:phosphoglycerate dehydrogenase-like enzyme
MSCDVLCLRPEADFIRAGATLPPELSVLYRAADDSDVPDLMKAARALVIPAVGGKIPPPWFEGTHLQLVQVTGAGLDRLDQTELKRLGIPVANVPAGSNSAVAEYAVASAVILLRRLAWADQEIRRGNYKSFRARMVSDNLMGLEGIWVGIVGLGVIGLAVAQAFHKLGCRICYHDPAPRDASAAASISAKSLALDDLLKTADVVSLHVPLLPVTRGLIGEGQLAGMKPGAVLIHASRGAVVDELALSQSLSSGHLGGAAVDVYSDEPPAAENPLLQLKGEAGARLLLTPHIAGVTRQSAAFLCQSAWSNVERVLIHGQPPLNRAY